MPLSEQTAAGVTLLRLPAELRGRIQIPHIIAWTRRACDELALWCVERADPATQEFGTKTFADVNIAAGVADISAYLAATEPLLGEGFPYATLRHSSMTDTDPDMMWVQSVAELREERSKAFIYFTLDGTNLRVRNRDGSLTSLDAVTLSIKCAYSPLVASIPRNLEEKYLDILRNVVIAAATAGLIPATQEDGL